MCLTLRRHWFAYGPLAFSPYRIYSKLNTLDNAVLRLCQRCRQWANVKSALVERIVMAGWLWNARLKILAWPSYGAMMGQHVISYVDAGPTLGWPANTSHMANDALMLGHYHRRCYNVGTALAKFSHRFSYTVTWLDVPRPDGAVWLLARCD